MKVLSLLALFISKIKRADIHNFLPVKYFGKGLLFLNIWHMRVNYCWSYGPSNLLFPFFRCRLGHLDNRQTKIAENSSIHFFKRYQSNISARVYCLWKFDGKGLLFLKFWHMRVNYCWSYGPPNLLFRFFRYRLCHLDKRQANSRKLGNTFFWKLAPKQVFLESFKFFEPPTTKWRPFKFFVKLNGNHILMANFSKLRKYQTFVLIELHNLSKG